MCLQRKGGDRGSTSCFRLIRRTSRRSAANDESSIILYVADSATCGCSSWLTIRMPPRPCAAISRTIERTASGSRTPRRRRDQPNAAVASSARRIGPAENTSSSPPVRIVPRSYPSTKISATADREATGVRRDDLDEGVRVGVHAFASQPRDGQASVVQDADRRIDPTVDSGDGELHELADREGSGRVELQNLPMVEERASRLRSFRDDEIGLTLCRGTATPIGLRSPSYVSSPAKKTVVSSCTMTSSDTSARYPRFEANRSRSTRASAGGNTGTDGSAGGARCVGVMAACPLSAAVKHLVQRRLKRLSRRSPQDRLADKSIEAAASSSVGSNGLRRRTVCSTQRLHLRRDSRVRERSHDDDRRREPGSARRAYRLQPAHPRHPDVRDDEIEWSSVRELLDQLCTTRRAHHVGAHRRERVSDRIEQLRIIIRNQDMRMGQHRRPPTSGSTRRSSHGCLMGSPVRFDGSRAQHSDTGWRDTRTPTAAADGDHLDDDADPAAFAVGHLLPDDELPAPAAPLNERNFKRDAGMEKWLRPTLISGVPPDWMDRHSPDQLSDDSAAVFRASCAPDFIADLVASAAVRVRLNGQADQDRRVEGRRQRVRPRGTRLSFGRSSSRARLAFPGLDLTTSQDSAPHLSPSALPERTRPSCPPRGAVWHQAGRTVE